jgi:DMSO/TMAO reductase YedYZ molybdopterin-dependent catalytic subunit
LHYGPVRVFGPGSRDLRASGATRAGGGWNWTTSARCRAARSFSLRDGQRAQDSLDQVRTARRPGRAAAALRPTIWLTRGGANLPLDVFAAPDTLLATHRDGTELRLEQGHPIRLVVPSRYGWKSVKWVRAVEYMIGDRRGFWEERGYQNGDDPWLKQRYSYQEQPGEGPKP